MREGLAAAGLEPLEGESAIIPIIVGETATAIAISERLLENGVYVTGFGYPVVPEGTARVRIQVSAALTATQIEAAVAAITEVAGGTVSATGAALASAAPWEKARLRVRNTRPMAEDNVDRYREAIDAWNRRDLVWILEQATPDFEFHTAQLFPGTEPVYRGREGMVEFWTTFIEAPWALLRIDVEEMLPAGDDRALALLTFTGIERGSTTEVTLKYAHLVSFRGPEVARIDAFADWEDARAAAGLEG